MRANCTAASRCLSLVHHTATHTAGVAVARHDDMPLCCLFPSERVCCVFAAVFAFADDWGRYASAYAPHEKGSANHSLNELIST